jgi:ribosomal subunit interface protein
MDVTVSGRHVDITPAMKEYAVKRVSKLSKYFARTEKVHVTLNVEGVRHLAELVLSPGKGAPLIVAAETDDMYATLDSVVDKAEERLTRYKGKLYGRRSRAKQAAVEVPVSPRPVPSHLVDLREGHMKLLEFISADAILDDVKSAQKEDLIEEMVQALVDAGDIKQSDLKGVVKSLLRREELGSTGIGRGVAVPHAKHGSIKDVVGTVAVAGAGVDFDALDGEPTHVFFLLVASTDPDASESYLKALERVSVAIRDARFSRFLRTARGKDEIVELLTEYDERQ